MEAKVVYTGAHDVREGEIIVWTPGDLSLPLPSHAPQRHVEDTQHIHHNGDKEFNANGNTHPHEMNGHTALHDHHGNGHSHEHHAAHDHHNHPVHPAHEHAHGHTDHNRGHKDHHDHEHTPSITRRWQQALVYGNLLIGAAGIVAGGSDTMSVTMDGGHNVADFVTYKIQTDNELHGHKHQEEALTRRRKLAHSIIMLSSLVGASKIGVDILGGEENTVSDSYDIAAASASVLLNSSLLFKARKTLFAKAVHRSEHAKDILKHFLYVDIPSALLAFSGALVQPMNSKMEQVFGIANGAIAAWAFRPTKKNLAHNCLDHDHGHDHHEHAHDHSPTGIIEDDFGTHDSTASRPNRLRSIKTSLANASIHAGATAINATGAMAAFADEKIRKRKLLSGIVGIGGVLLGGYVAIRNGSHSELSRTLHEAAAQRPAGASASDSFPVIATHGFRIEELQNLSPHSDVVQNIVHLDKYRARSDQGTVWGIARQILADRHISTPATSDLASVTNALLTDNGITHQQAAELPLGFPINTSGTHTVQALASIG